MTKEEALDVLDRLQDSLSNLRNNDTLDWECIEALQIARKTLEKEIKGKKQRVQAEMGKLIDDMVHYRYDPTTSKTPINLLTRDEYGNEIIVVT